MRLFGRLSGGTWACLSIAVENIMFSLFIYINVTVDNPHVDNL